MPTRSGKRYLIWRPGDLCDYCRAIQGFILTKTLIINVAHVGNIVKKMGIMTMSKEFGDKCRQWAKDNTVDEITRKFILRNKNISDQHLYNLLTGIFINTKNIFLLKLV